MLYIKKWFKIILRDITIYFLTYRLKHHLWFTRDSFDTSSPSLASKAMRLLSASLAFSSAAQNKTKTNKQKIPRCHTGWKSQQDFRKQMRTLISAPTHQSLPGDLLSLLLAQLEFWIELMSIYKPFWQNKNNKTLECRSCRCQMSVFILPWFI